jgi:hypothetical protein
MNFQFTRSMVAAGAWLVLTAASVPACAGGAPAGRAAMATAAHKPNDSGVGIQHSVPGVAQIGQPVSIVLQFDGITDPAGAKVRFTTDGGLTLTTTGSLTLPAGQSTSVTATVASDRDGVAYLNVFVTQNGALSSAAIPVQTGPGTPAMKGAGEVKSSAEGDKIISSPAKEPPRAPKTPEK